MNEDLKNQLVGLASLSAKCSAATGEIKRRAEARMQVVGSRLNELRPMVLTSEKAEDEYLGLVQEQGRLRRVLQS